MVLVACVECSKLDIMRPMSRPRQMRIRSECSIVWANAKRIVYKFVIIRRDYGVLYKLEMASSELHQVAIAALNVQRIGRYIST